jgi:hypothetical protein
MTNKRYFGFADFSMWVRDQVTGVMDALNLKADKTSVHTKQEALETFLAIAGKAVDSSLLDGKTKAQIILEAIAAANLDTKLDVTARTEFATAAQGVKADTAVQPDVLQAALNTKLNASGYTAGDVLAKLLTVDGPNSGLDADALDGKQLATIEAEYKAFTNAAISALVDSSPDALNTLNELATALGNDPNFATTITNQLASKVDKTDTRLTDAREWSATTITQSEAETGVATTRRAWTAQRVRQAIAAWWTGSADKTKLDGIAAGAQVNVPTDLGYTTGATAGTITSSTGTNASLPGATTAAAGLLSAADKAKLNGISAGATVNSTDAALLSRSNHTGTQAISTVSGLQAALDAKFSTSGGTVNGNITASTFYTGNWFRSTGATGWYSETYGGGIHMSDTTWVRVYGSKSFYVEGNIAATGEISGFYSDERLKENMTPIEGALESLRTITGYRYTANELAAGFGYDPLKPEVGFSAQEWQVVAPEIVELAPFDYDDDGEPNVSRSGEYYLTMKYHRTLPYVVMAINELADLADNDRSKLDQLVLSVEQIKVQLTELQSQLEK